MQKLQCLRRAGSVERLTFSPNGDLLAGIGHAGLLRRTPLYCWTRSRDWELSGLEDKGRITGVAFHPTGRTWAYATITSSLWAAPLAQLPPRPAGGQPPSIWRRRFAREKLAPFTGIHLDPLNDVHEFVPHRLYVPQTENESVQPETWARGLTFTPDGRALVAGQVDYTGDNLERVNVLHWLFTETDGVWQVGDPVAARGETVNGGALVGGYLVLAGAWGVAACPIESPSGLFVPDVRAATVVALAPCGELVAMQQNEALVVWHLRHAEPVGRARIGPAPVTALAFAPDGTTLAIGTAGKVVGVWNPFTGAYGPERDFGVGPVTALAYAPDGLTLAVAGRDGVVVVDTE